jgi:hypothetical protein
MLKGVKVVKQAVLFVLCLVSLETALASNDNVTVVKLHQTNDALRETYAKGKHIGLPRVVMLDSQGHAVYTRAGFSSDLTHQLHKALTDDKNVEPRINLDLILSETTGDDGRAIATADLPPADAYVIDYWADWCSPCHELKRKLDSALHSWNGKTFVWLQIESDPKKLPDKA